MDIGEKIRQLRLHKKLTQRELVEGISSITYLSRIETGDINPSLSFLEEISGRLDVQAADLLDKDNSDAAERILHISERYRCKQTLTEADLSFLNLHTSEMHSTETYVKMYTTLIRYYLDQEKDVETSEQYYVQSRHFVPLTVPDELATDYYFYYISCGNLFYLKQDYIKANHYYCLAEQFSNHVDDAIAQAKLYLNISLVKKEMMEDKYISLVYAQKAYEIFREKQEEHMMINTLIIMGVLFHLTKNYKKSLNILHEAMQQTPADDKLSLGLILYNFGRVYVGEKEFSKAIEHFQLSIERYRECGEEHRITYPYLRLIEVYTELKDWNQVESYLGKAMQGLDSKNMSYMHLKLLSIQARFFLLRGNENRYEREMQKIIESGAIEGHLKLSIQLASQLAHHYYEKRAYKKSANYFKLVSDYNDQLTKLMINNDEATIWEF
ncbi:helix-turn-helix transcriptional regulator [Mechercharimyces sp. CAU 1602]|nr:helix-turn-helix transcriptional regulator [Mechercharimyces sp. CAU 1602]